MLLELAKEIYLIPFPWGFAVAACMGIFVFIEMIARAVWAFIDDRVITEKYFYGILGIIGDTFVKPENKLENITISPGKWISVILLIPIILTCFLSICVVLWIPVIFVLVTVGSVYGLRECRRGQKNVTKLLKHMPDKEGKVTIPEEEDE